MIDFIGRTYGNIKKIIKRRKNLILLLLLIVFAVFSALPFGKSLWRELSNRAGFKIDTDAPLNIHVIDVGKADSILLECEGHYALLDAGTSVNGDDVCNYLSRCGVNLIDFVIVSHPDKDHIGGMAQVISEFNVKKLVRSKYHSDEYDSVRSILKENAVAEDTVSVGDEITLGGAEIRILGPLKNSSDTNNDSLVFRLKYQDFSAIFCGDIEEEAELDLVNRYSELSAELLKVAHHGSKTSSTKEFLLAVAPKYAVISVGRDNNELPKETVLRRLDDVCLDVYRTDTDGTVIFSYDKNEISVKTEKN